MPSPQRIRWAKLRIAVVVVSALSILAVLVYLLGGNTWFKPKTYLTTYIPDATGIDPGADVQLNGVLIGKVEWVRLTHSRDPNRVVEVRLQIGEQFRPYIPDDSVSEIDSTNLLGDTYIDILMGKSQRPVQPAGELAFRPPSTMMPKTSDLRQFDAQLKSIDQTIIDMQAGKGPLGQFVVGDALYKQFLDGVVKVEKQMRAATASQSQLGQVLYGTTMIDKAATHSSNWTTGWQSCSRAPCCGTRRSTIRSATRSHRCGARWRTSTRARARADNSSPSDADYVEWNRRVAAWIQSVDTLNSGEGSMGQMVTNAQTYESLNGELRELETTIKEFRENPRKYLAGQVEAVLIRSSTPSKASRPGRLPCARRGLPPPRPPASASTGFSSLPASRPLSADTANRTAAGSSRAATKTALACAVKLWARARRSSRLPDGMRRRTRRTPASSGAVVS